MKNDIYYRIGYYQDELIDALRKNPKLDYTGTFLIDCKKYNNASKETFIPISETNNWNDRNNDQSIEEYHTQLQNNWKMPEKYKSLDIEQLLLNACINQEQQTRVELELNLYRKFNLIDLLRYLKYLRDVAHENNIVWGVGRGSSCSSFCLYILKIHMVDSLYYNLDINEFLR